MGTSAGVRRWMIETLLSSYQEHNRTGAVLQLLEMLMTAQKI